MSKRIRLTTLEIDAIVSIGNNVDAGATVEMYDTVEEGDVMLAAFESGMEKLRHMLARRKGED